LGIRKIEANVKRQPGGDSAMITTGAELARREKGCYAKLMLIWDFHGSGREYKEHPEESAKFIQKKLDGITWTDNSLTVVLVPELEEWLWHCPNSVSNHLGLRSDALNTALERFAATRKSTTDLALRDNPKEAWEYVKKRVARQTISPRDFRQIAEQASLTAWRQSASFDRIVTTLQTWFTP
jgi:hypothetical protein